MKKILNLKIFKIIKSLIYSFFVICLLCYIFMIGFQRFSGNKSFMGYRFFTVATGSMAGVYDINDIIAVVDCNPDELKVGDDVAYHGNRGGFEGLIITHRIIKIEESDSTRIFTTKGVNALMEDPVITSQQIIGKVSGVVPVITPINHIVKSQFGFFFLIFVPLTLIIVLEILQTITDYQMDREESKNTENKNIQEEIEIL